MSSGLLSSSDRSAAFFDRLAPRYDEVWTNSPAGRAQRNAVWRHLDPLIRPGIRVLDMGCGTGEDALHLERLGAHVLGVDASPEMVRIARGRGVNARVLPIEGVHSLSDAFDLVLSDFGGLNCVRELSPMQKTLVRLVRPGGALVLCMMNRFCLTESARLALTGQIGKAVRRWRGEAITSAGVEVFYPSSKQVRTALSPGFDLIADVGVGIAVPSSLGTATPSRWAELLSWIDARLEASRIGRAICDHRLFIFRRR